MKSICGFLLDNAGASIRYRVKKEILKNMETDEKVMLQNNILNEKDVQYILGHKQPDGWLGSCFHSRMKGAKALDVCEAALRYLAEKGVELEHPVFEGVMNAYLTREKNDPIYDGFWKGEEDFRYTCWGLWLVRSSGIARCGFEKKIDISREIECSLQSFLNVLNYENIEEVLRLSKNGTYYFKEGLLWPCNYHLKILAFTDSWRTESNLLRLAEAIEHVLSFPKSSHPVYTRIQGNYISPCDAFIDSPIAEFNYESVKGEWFDKMELFARCGVIPYSKRLLRETSLLKESIDGNGICQANIDEKFFRNWGAYSGLKLEDNWRTNLKKKCDITFRALLVLAHSLTMEGD